MNLDAIKVTEKKLVLFDKLNINSVEELLHHYPFRYEYREAKPFIEWEKDENVYFEAEIISKVTIIRHGGKKSTMRFRVIYEDNEIELLLFNRFYAYGLQIGKKITIFGKYVGKNQVFVSTYNDKPLEEQLGIIPIYRSTEGMRPSDWKKYIDRALEVYKFEDIIPEKLINKYKLLKFNEAIYHIHKPNNDQELQAAIRTIKFNEIFKFQLLLQYNCHDEINNKEKKVIDTAKIDNLINTLPYELTNGQKNAIDDILSDLQSEKVMCRLLQGDVGCGKTLVAIVALYGNCLANFQSAFLVPTEILARQHYVNMQELLKDYDANIALLTSSISNDEKNAVLKGLLDGDVDIVVGTHSLIQNTVKFAKLGLVVADEQHRFGVNQRKAILDKGESVDFLSMSATPIPRTLATSMFGDLNISTISELPKGRQEVYTKVIKENSIRSIQEDMLKAIAQGSKIYIVASSIEESDNQRNVVSLYNNMQKAFPNINFGLLHGKMNNDEKNHQMMLFENGETQVLVATTVIEVGVDVKGADWIIIYDSDRFGLNQLHQLRGRVGRHGEKGYCYLLTSSTDENTLIRLQSLEKCKNGFDIAKQDLILRGPGDLLGTKQSGSLMFVLADLEKDKNMLEVAMDECINIIEKLDEYPILKKYINEQENLGKID